MERVCLIHYHEIGLKGRNRSVFERRLQSNLDSALVGLPVRKTERIASRLVVPIQDAGRAEEVAAAVAAIPGVNSVSLAYRITQDPLEMERVALAALNDAGEFATFKVEARRSNTEYAELSLEMNNRIGAHLKAESRRVQGLGARQREQLMNRLG